MEGFSLVELLVALAVFSVVATIAYVGLSQIARGRSQLDGQVDALLAARAWMNQLEADLEQALARPARGPHGESEPALQGSGTGLSLSTRRLAADPEGMQAVVERVRIVRRGRQLLREVRLQLDPDPLEQLSQSVLVEGLEFFDLRYLDRNLEPQAQWPPLGSPRLDELPRAVEVLLEFEGGGGRVRRVFELPESPLAPPA